MVAHHYKCYAEALDCMTQQGSDATAFCFPTCCNCVMWDSFPRASYACLVRTCSAAALAVSEVASSALPITPATVSFT